MPNFPATKLLGVFTPKTPGQLKKLCVSTRAFVIAKVSNILGTGTFLAISKIP